MRGVVRPRIAVPTALVVLARAAPASAHSPVKELGEFYGGLLHPALVPAHALLVLALGLLLWAHGPRAARGAILAFLPLAAAGLAAVWLAAAPPLPASLPLAVAAAAGLLVALAIRLPLAILAPLAGTAGLMVGLDTTPEPAATAAARDAFLLGGLSGIAAAVLLVIALVLRVPATVRPVAVRVAGSWSAAVALLVLPLGAVGRAGLP
jgi:urease accessory protein